MGLPTTRASYIATGIGPKIPIATIAELVKKKATHVSFHSNRINSLEIARRRGKNTDVEAIISRENCAEHVLELDLSSNNLHEGCELSQFSCPTRFSLLSMTANLVNLNLASNNLNAKSLHVLVCIKKSNGTIIPLLPNLRHLDVSHNNISRLPGDIGELFPALTHFLGTNNRLGSLTELLQTLHKFRGRLQSIHLLNGKSSNSNNPVCRKRLYREKMVFILGDNLKRLDGVRISKNERNKVRLDLARDYEIDMSNSNGQRQQHNSDIVNAQYNPSYSPQSSDDSFKTPSEAPHSHAVRCIDHNDTESNKDKQIPNLEVQVASLSALIEKQAYLTTNRLESTTGSVKPNELEHRSSDIVDTGESNTEIPQSDNVTHAPQHVDSNIWKRQKSAVATGVMRLFFVEYKRKRANVFLAFSRWRLVLEVFAKARRTLADSEEKWQKKSITLIKAAVSKEAKKNSDKISCLIKAEQVAHKKSMGLTSAIQELEKKLKDDLEKHKDTINSSNITIDELQDTILQLNATLAGKNEELSKTTQQHKANLEVISKELETTKKELKVEKAKRASLETETALASNRSEEAITSCMEELEDLKLQIVQKDVSLLEINTFIQQISPTIV